MAQSSQPVKVTLEKPTKDLRALGEKLQQAIQLTRARLPEAKLPRERLRVIKSLDHAEYMYTMISNTCQTVERMGGFLQRGFGLDMDALFALAGGNEKAARVSTYSAMVMVNQGISLALKDLSRVNEILDKEKEK